jgi:hypothetical protein
MATITWLIKKNAEAAQTLAAAGITSCVPSYKANGVDSVTFVQSDDWLAAPAWPYGSVVALIRRTVDGEATTDRCVFVGKVESIPRQASGGGPQAIAYTALGPAYELQRCELSQEWTHTSDAGIATTVYEPTVVLGEDNNGLRLTSGQTINYALAYAVTRGVAIDIGTIAAGVLVPYDERDNIKCWDAVVAMLRYTPDYVLWWDYDNQVDGQYLPAANLTAPAAMTVVTKALIGADATEAAFTPRYDIRADGILITYRWTGEYDGRTIKSRSTDSAGDINSPRRVSLVYDLEGSRSVFITQEVEVEDYPADWTDATGKAALVKLIPWLEQLPTGDWSVTSVDRSGLEDYPARLLSGAVPKWTTKHTESETFTVRVAYKIKSTDTTHVLDEGSKDLTFTAISTDASTHTYRKQTEWVEAEPVPPGLAAALLASWNRLHYDGQVTLHEQECAFDIMPGMMLSCTGGMAEWATMAAVVQDVTCDIASGMTTVRTGTCGRLEADNLMAIYRAARGRRFSCLRLGRSSGDSTDGNQVDGASGTPNDTVADGTPACLRKRFAVEAADAGSRVHLVDINPAAIAFATAGNAAAQTLQLREMVMPYMDGSTLKAKLAQVLCGAGYGSEIPLGGARPANPANAAARGSSSEADLSSSTAYDPASPGSYDGLSLVVSLGSYYDDTAGTPILKDFRVTLTWPNAIAPTVSAVSTVTIDQPTY